MNVTSLRMFKLYRILKWFEIASQSAINYVPNRINILILKMI